MKPFKTIEEQFFLLKSRGLNFENEEKSKRFLLNNNEVYSIPYDDICYPENAELYRSKREECAVAGAAIAGVAGNVVKAASAYEARSFGCYG